MTACRVRRVCSKSTRLVRADAVRPQRGPQELLPGEPARGNLAGQVRSTGADWRGRSNGCRRFRSSPRARAEKRSRWKVSNAASSISLCGERSRTALSQVFGDSADAAGAARGAAQGGKKRCEDLDKRFCRRPLAASIPGTERNDLAKNEPGSSTSPLHRGEKAKPERSTWPAARRPETAPVRGLEPRGPRRAAKLGAPLAPACGKRRQGLTPESSRRGQRDETGERCRLRPLRTGKDRGLANAAYRVLEEVLEKD